MRGLRRVAAAAALASCASAASSSTSEPCGIVASGVQAFTASNSTGFPTMPASLALSCLESIPIDVGRDIDFVDYIEPYLEFQSSLAYLKNPPVGYTLPGVDVLGGLAQIRSNLVQGKYTTQWAFEKDFYILVNILPHDFHFNLDLPLIRLFFFKTGLRLVSVSVDGESIPQPYSYSDLEQQYLAAVSNETLDWTPAAIVTVDGESVADVLERTAEQTSQFQDPDGFYNLQFFTIPTAFQQQGSTWNIGSHAFGFDSDFTNYTFANGTERSDQNVAITTFDFTDVVDGASLFQAFEVPPTTTPTPTAPTPTQSTPAITSISGYPSPIVIHPQGYTAGYFLEDGETAVLAMTAFTNPQETIDGNALQQKAIKDFLAACTKNSMKKLIIDLSSNGGGSVFNGIDAFKQLFPQLEPFGASRYRFTDAMNFFGTIYTGADIHNMSFATEFQTQGSLDINEKHFDNWADLAGPVEIYGDRFTNMIRENMSDPLLQLGNGLIVSGYLNNTDIPPQPFASEDIVLLYDGSCGSTCAVFSELMKSQGGVRSVGVGGRPTTGPIQGVGGSKGAQVLTYGSIQQLVAAAPVAAQIFAEKGLTFPPTPNVNLTTLPAPLKVNPDGNRFNLRNNYHDPDAQDAPLQFVYEATNCRLYYQAFDYVSQENLWNRVANVTWGNGKCVSGSSVNSDDTMPTGAYDTVPFSLSAMSSVQLPPTLGLVTQKNSTTSTNTTATNTTVTIGSPTPSASSTDIVRTNSAPGLSIVSIPLLSMLGFLGMTFALL